MIISTETHFLRVQNLRQTKSYIHDFVCFEKEKKYLLSELPEKYKNAKVQYCTAISHHYNSQKERIEYNNTTAFININGNKSKTSSPEEIRIQLILERLFEINTRCNFLKKNIKSYCNSINSSKKCHEPGITFRRIKESTTKEIHASNELVHISEKNAWLSYDNFHKSALSKSSGTSLKNNSNLSATFPGLLIGPHSEIYRSKNELLSSLCLNDCGLCYTIEPFYPNSNMRADFSIFCSYTQNENGKISVLKKPIQVFVEIAGKRNNPEYEARLQFKIKTAKHYKIPLLVIDATDYSSIGNKTIFDYEYLCDIFTQVYFGMIGTDGTILTPYR